MAVADVLHHRRGEALELLTVLEVVLGQSRIGELANDAAVATLVELLAQPARLADVLDQRGELGALQRSLLATIHVGGNVTQAAERAGVERESMHRLLKRHGARSDDFKPRGS